MTIEIDSWSDIFEPILERGGLIVIYLVAIALLLRLTTYLIEKIVRNRAKVFSIAGMEESDDKRTDSVIRVLTTAARAFFSIFAAMVVLSELGVNAAALLASVSVVSIAVGFGAQYLVKDYLSGLVILTEDQFRVGDWVQLNTVSGTVEDMRLRLTVLRDGDGVLHHVPNGEIRIASNFSKEFGLINLLVTVDYSTDLRAAFEAINDVCDGVTKDPEYAASILEAPHAQRINDLSPNGPVIKIVGRTTASRKSEIAGELRLRLKEKFDERGIAIGMPQMVVHQAGPETNGFAVVKQSRTRKGPSD